jgi:peptide/nickel transport system ATP-binding protein
MTEPLLTLDAVARAYVGRQGLFGKVTTVRAVDGVSLALARGETLGIVGESGSGKSTLGRMALGMETPDEGRVTAFGEAMPALGTPAWRAVRRRMQMVFQDPLGALDRRLPVLDQVAEPLIIHGIGDAKGRQDVAMAALQAVGLSPEQALRYPHALSGGQRQRVVIARADHRS